MNWGDCTVEGVARIQCLEVIFQNLITSVGALASIVFLVMLLVGGFKYLTSAGNPKGVEAAKGTITAALLGIVAIVGAYIVLVVLSSFTGLTLTTFRIGI